MLTQPSYTKVTFVSDLHAPFQDDKAFHAYLEFQKWYKPDKIFIMGDWVDCYAVSDFSKDPERALKLQEELDVGYHYLELIRKTAPKAEIFYLRGNHEKRIQRYLWTKASELSGLRSLTVPNLLNLAKLKIKYVETGKMMFFNTIIKHGTIVRKFSGYSAHGEFEKAGISGVSVHTHRLGDYLETKESGIHEWIECGCLCKLDPEYMEGEVANWQQGFGIGFYKKSGRFNMQIIKIINHKAMYDGHEFYI